MSLKNIKVNKNNLDNKIDIIDSEHLINNDSDNESYSESSINWSENENQNNEKSSEEEEELDEDDEIVNLSKLTNKSIEEEIDTVNDITFEITKDEKNNKCVKVTVLLDIESSSDIINIEFLISKETCLKLANQLE